MYEDWKLMTLRSTPLSPSSGSSSPKEVLGARAQELLSKAGGAVENIIGRHIETAAEAPLFDGAPVAKVWYRLPLSGAMSGDGSGYHIYVKKGFTSRLCLFFSGGGVAWNAFTAARPVTGSAVAAGEPNYYWNNLRPFTQFMNINIGITETNTARNPFDDWNFVVVTYATGDFHVGRGDFMYTSEDGRQEILHFHGYENFRESMKAAVSLFPNPSKLLIAGDSAGAFAVPALSGIITDEFYPDCKDITLFSDSAQLLYKDWRQTARDIWKADERFWQPLHTDNIFLDWYEALLSSRPDRFRCLYASTTHDYLLSTFLNDVTNKSYSTDSAVQDLFYRQLQGMVRQLRGICPGMAFFISDWKHLVPSQGGTVHTAVRQPFFYLKTKDNISMAEWLSGAVDGNLQNVGLGLLEQDETGC